jgi:hypothetical protein
MVFYKITTLKHYPKQTLARHLHLRLRSRTTPQTGKLTEPAPKAHVPLFSTLGGTYP